MSSMIAPFGGRVMHALAKALFVFLPLGLAFTTSHAQTEPPAGVDPDLWEVDLDNIVVTAQYAPTDSRSAIHQVKTVTAKEIRQQGYNNLSEVLTQQLNIRVSTDPILGNGLSIQGISGQNVQILIDGVPVIGRVGGNVDLSQINLQNVERIEIVEGAMSAQYGSNASGGVVNIITKKSQLKTLRFETEHQYEDIGIRRHNYTGGINIKDRLYASATVSTYNAQFAETDSMRIFEAQELASGGQIRTRKVPWNPKEQLGMEGMLRYRFNDSMEINYQYRDFDETLTLYGERRRPRFRPYAIDNEFLTRRRDHRLALEGYLGSRFYLKSTTAFNDYDRINRVSRLDFEADTTSILEAEGDTATFTAFLHRTVLSSINNSFLNWQLGVEWLGETGSGDRIVDSTHNPINEVALSNYALWAGIQVEPFEKMRIMANLRYGYNTKYDHPLIPSLHMDWRPYRDWQFKFSYAQGFRAPTLKELHFRFIDINHYIIGNPNLRPEVSHNLSLWGQYEGRYVEDQVFTAEAKLFYNNIRERIVLTEFETARYNYQNISDFQTHGLNLQLSYRWANEFFVRSGFAYTRLYNFWSEEASVKKFIGLPEMQSELQITLPGVNTQFSVNHRLIGRQIRFFESSDGEVEEGFIGAYQLVNVTTTHNFWKGRIQLGLGIKNLFDTETVPLLGQSGGAHSGGGDNLLLGWGRTYFARLRVSLP